MVTQKSVKASTSTSTLDTLIKRPSKISLDTVGRCRAHWYAGTRAQHIKYWQFYHVNPNLSDQSYALQEHEGVPDWKTFVLALDPLSIAEKLAMLENRYTTMNCYEADYGAIRTAPKGAYRTRMLASKPMIEWIRINAYIAYLIEGNELNFFLEIPQ